MALTVGPHARAALAILLVGALAACSGSGDGPGGAAGTTGTAGTIGTAGATAGAAGTSTAGAAGTAGTGGSTAGASGSAGGRGGAAGTAGAAGGGGDTSGGAGSSGRGGSAGTNSGGRGGSAGANTDGGAPDGGAAGTGGAGTGGGGYLPCPTTGACAVMPLGDSITEGYPANNGSYRVELFRQAVTNGKGLTFVGTLMNGPGTVASKTFPTRHEGHRGYTIDTGGSNSGISGQVVDQALASQPPKIVLLMIGTNDVDRNVDVGNAPTRLGKLIDEIGAGAPSALIVVSTIIPIADTTKNARVQDYNAALPGLVSLRAAAGKHVVLLDSYAAFVSDPNYKTTLMADALHPNDAGYVLLGKAFYGLIGPLLPPGP